ncbi:MAG: VWA containing CoxE family protein [Myxococcota bacterium]|nr:VWA containing CoxE family protein [Myxococcota bacterium]
MATETVNSGSDSVHGRLFLPLLYNLRAQGLPVGTGEWLAFLEGLKANLARDLDGVYRLGRALLVHKEAHYDAYDIAFHATFAGVELKPELKEALESWLNDPAAWEEGRPPGEHQFASLEELLQALADTLREQQERHEGGNRWVGTGGTSPYGNSGKANQGVRIGGSGGGRSAVRVAGERRWQGYRTDLKLEIRDFKVALRELRKLKREGHEVLDLDGTIDSTAKNAGDIDLVFTKERANRVRLLLLMDAGGSMAPHAQLVSRLFTASKEMKTFKSLDHYYFHNCVYGWLYRDYQTWDRRRTEEVLRELTPEHRVIFVGDASMAPWELFADSGGFGERGPSGHEWLQRIKAECPHSVWLNPDPQTYWRHPTVSAIGTLFPMFPLTIDGLREATRKLRAA